jgi:NADH:ubiquinone oxidoreductase subunit D
MYVEKIEKAGPAHLQVVEDHLHLDLEDDGNLVDEAEDTLTILNKYVESITNDNTDKQALSNLMRELYTEALNTI